MYNLSSHDSRWYLTICSLLLFLVSNWVATCFINAIRPQFFIQLIEKMVLLESHGRVEYWSGKYLKKKTKDEKK